MHLSPRNHLILELVSKFGFLTSKQLQSLVFHTTKSNNPSYRAFDLLVQANYLAPLGVGYVGSSRGGRSQRIYKLGSRGQRVMSHRPTPRLDYLNHTLAVADIYVLLVELERAGKLQVLYYATEPDCWFEVKGNGYTYSCKPDFTVYLRRADGVEMSRLIEVDFASQADSVITEKLGRYWHAYQAADTSQWQEAQLVWFLSMNPARAEARAEELRRLIARGTDEQRGLFRVMTLPELEAALSG